MVWRCLTYIFNWIWTGSHMTFSEPVMDTENIFTKGPSTFIYVKISFLICHYLILVTVAPWNIKKQCRAMLLISEWCGLNVSVEDVHTHLIPLIFTACKISHSRSQWLLACWDRGFESHRWHGYLSVVSVVCCQVEVSVMSWSLVQRSPTDCGASLCVI